MKRRFLILAIALLAAAIGVIRVTQIQHRLRERVQVESWTRSLDHYDSSLTQAENDFLRSAGLRSLGPIAIKVLREDLNYDPPRRNWLKRGPEWFQGLFVSHTDWRQTWRPEEVRRQAAFHLADLGAGSLPALSDLLQRAADADPGVRDAVAIALGSTGQASPAILEALNRIVESKQARPRFSAAFSLWRLQPDDPVARARLERLITQKNLSWASLCLWRVGELGTDFAPAVLKAMNESTSTFAQMQAAKTLWLITKDPTPARLVLQTIDRELADKAARRTAASRWKTPERDLASAAIILDDIPECREAIKPLLERVKNESDSDAREMATAHLARIEQLAPLNSAPAGAP